jgi:hypothetical protein
VHLDVGDFVKFLVLLAVTLPVGSLFAQDSNNTGSQSQIPGNTAPPLLQRPYEAAKDFFNFFAFANGVLDTDGAYLQNANSGATFGETLGGGASGYHAFSTGSLAVYYNGDYRHYGSNNFGNGTDQSLSIMYQKLTKHWTFTVGEVAGTFFQGGSAYSTAANSVNPATIVQTSPYATSTKYAGTTLTASYQQSLRLSYQFTGSYFLNRYSGAVSVGSNNFIGGFATVYRLTRRTSISGNYSHSNFLYQHNQGSSNVDAVYVSLGHDFATHWTVSFSGGVTRANSSGTFQAPVYLNPNLPPVGFVVEQYHQTNVLPYYQATLSRNMRHLTVSASGGESVGPGNGYYLASRVLNVNGLVNYGMRRSNFSANGYFSRLSSVANAVTGNEVTTGIGAAYSYNLIRHLGLNARYDYIKYGNLGILHVPADNRISFGVYFTSKDVPLSWH